MLVDRARQSTKIKAKKSQPEAVLAEYFASQQKMVVKNTKTKIKMFNHLRAGIRIRKARKMVKKQNTVSPNKDSSMIKVMRSNYLKANTRIGKTKKVVKK